MERCSLKYEVAKTAAAAAAQIAATSLTAAPETANMMGWWCTRSARGGSIPMPTPKTTVPA